MRGLGRVPAPRRRMTASAARELTLTCPTLVRGFHTMSRAAATPPPGVRAWRRPPVETLAGEERTKGGPCGRGLAPPSSARARLTERASPNPSPVVGRSPLDTFQTHALCNSREMTANDDDPSSQASPQIRPSSQAKPPA